MQLSKSVASWIAILAITGSLSAAPRKVHVVGLGAFKRVPYSRAGDPAGATVGENTLKIRPLIVDGLVKEWTTGESHDVTDRSFVVRRVLHINDELPGEKSAANRWVWQRGPWLLVDRVSGHISALKLPDYDPGVSQVSWFRDYAAYCGLTTSGKSLYAVVAQLAVRKPVLSKKLAAFEAANRAEPVCASARWQRDPFRVTFNPSGMGAVSFEIVPGSAVLVEDSDDSAEPAAAAAKAN
ncbi:hypothetical protein [Occallatibacter savannae]|uniref:hypothetical protein n=1 Tax=Occallatibacter savannae TaxID=1002691 RepID=UPI000D69B148|nr:hypothetical protein [Occallatibacter savannae]